MRDSEKVIDRVLYVNYLIVEDVANYNRTMLADELKVSTRTINRYITIINNFYISHFIYQQVVFDYKNKCYIVKKI